MIVIIDYGMGNLKSVLKKVKKTNSNVIISSDEKIILSADKLILPGVGHFGAAMKNIKNLKLFDPINECVLIKKKPVLGICLGMQLMAKKSEEGNETGFGWFDAEVIRFDIKNKHSFKIPHVGWNSIHIEKKSALLNNIAKKDLFYFVHSYHFKCNNPKDILTKTDYSFIFDSAIEKNNVFGVQFHPEKSHSQGEQLFNNFINI